MGIAKFFAIKSSFILFVLCCNVGETRRSDPSASQCHIYTLDEKKVADPQLPPSRSVTFQTLVYDTNVGDISPLATYFNPDRISERELNLRFGHHPTSGEKHASGSPPKPG